MGRGPSRFQIPGLRIETGGTPHWLARQGFRTSPTHRIKTAMKSARSTAIQPKTPTRRTTSMSQSTNQLVAVEETCCARGDRRRLRAGRGCVRRPRPCSRRVGHGRQQRFGADRARSRDGSSGVARDARGGQRCRYLEGPDEQDHPTARCSIPPEFQSSLGRCRSSIATAHGAWCRQRHHHLARWVHPYQ